MGFGGGPKILVRVLKVGLDRAIHLGLPMMGPISGLRTSINLKQLDDIVWSMNGVNPYLEIFSM